MSSRGFARQYVLQLRTGQLELGPDTFVRHLDLPALGDLDGLPRLVARTLGAVLDLLDNVVALEHLAEDDVFPVEPAGDGGGDEELGSVGVFARVRHACDAA